ncbi:hypothetical protein CsSME_00032048 [Camellia sinensis var. sinensis]
MGPQFSYLNFRCHFPSLSRENPNLLNFSHRKWLYHPKILTLCSTITSDSLSYGGWDDPRLGGGSVHSGESNQLRYLDKRYIFVYLLGFICALAISRVRVSSTIVFPACVIVFSVGFSIGFVNGGHRPNDKKIRVSIKKLRNLMDFLSGFDGKINNLINGIRRGIGSNHITADDLESYIKVMESIGLSNLNARSVVEACTDTMLVENQEVERNLNQKLSRRKKEVGETGFDLLQFIGGLIRGNSVGLKHNKMRDSIKRDSNHVEAPTVDEKVLSSVFNDNLGNRNVAISGYARNKLDMVNEARRINLFVHDQMKISDHMITFLILWIFASFEQERILHKTNGSYRENREKETYKTHSREEERLISVDDPSHKSDIGSFPSLTVSDDIMFNRYLMEANAFLKEARECLRVNGDEGHAESVLYESEKLLCKAIDMKPLSTGCGPVGKYLSSSRRTEIENHDLVLIQKRGKVLKGLLVEAGRKYRLALSIDGNDTRALYNWGLALSFRAQLIADIGPEAAVDADKIFLAASDKFDAMVSKSNVYIHLMLCIDGVWHCSKGLDYGQGTVKRRRSYCSKQRGYIKTRLTLTQTISK